MNAGKHHSRRIYIQAGSGIKLSDGIRNVLEVTINRSEMSPELVVQALLRILLLLVYDKLQSIFHFFV